MTSAPERRVLVDGMYNLRDIGGYRSGSQRTKWQTVYRSDALHRLTPLGIDQFSRLGIETIIDLRDDVERAHQPTALPGAVRVIASPIFQGVDATINDPDISIGTFYSNLIENYTPNYVRGIRHIIEHNDGPVLVHCTAGKDRTGTLVALALTAIGVDREDVLHDYAQTEQYLAGEWADRHIEHMQSLGIELTPALRDLLVRSPSETLDAALASVESQHGSIVDYLRAHGLSDHEIDLLAALLLESSEASAE